MAVGTAGKRDEWWVAMMVALLVAQMVDRMGKKMVVRLVDN